MNKVLIKIKSWLFNEHWEYTISNSENYDISGHVVSVIDRHT